LSKDASNMRQQCLTPLENAAIIPALLDVEAKERKIARQVILLQVVLTLFGASIAYSIKGTPQYAIAVLGGGGISVVNGALLAWRMVRTASHPAHEAHHQLRLMYFYAAERFLVVVALLCICIVVMKLSPLALLGGFVMGQAVFVAGRFILSGFRLK
jgi:F0F1-type ATP synthase assembly protein I